MNERLRYDQADIDRFGCYVCKDKFAKPSPELLDDCEFIVTARYKQEYAESTTPWNRDRKGEHLIPVFFVYESDNLPKRQQLVEAMEITKSKYGSSIFTITDSASKSIHTLVYIDPKFQEKVAEEFGWYWQRVGQILFAEKAVFLDKACASIGRLSRLPGGYRGGIKEQVCYYKNPNPVGLDLTSLVEEHRLKVLKEKWARDNKLKLAKELFKDDEESEADKLERMHNSKTTSEAFDLFYEGIKNNNFPAGGNFVGAMRSARARGFSEELIYQFFDGAKAAHPSNLPKNFEYYYVQ